jgi:hypothetical protein
MDNTASPATYSDPATDYSALGFPQPATTETITPGGCTLDAPWQPEPNRRAGQRELAWFEAHRHELTGHEGKWIAITGEQVLVARDRFREVRAFLDTEGIANALIVHVRENVAERELFID